MSKNLRIIVVVAACAFAGFVPWTPRLQAQEPSLGDVARKYRGNKNAANPCPPTKPCDGSSATSLIAESEGEYRTEIQALLDRRDFAGLDEAAESDRSSRTRVKGGPWKLYVLYDVVSSPSGGKQAKDTDWTERLMLLKNWAASRPGSITARVALAECYYNYGWVARGGGYADTVGDDNWKLFETRLDQASQILLEAGKLTAQCPHWYFVMLEIARSLGWPQAGARALFAKAVAFEPSYYHSYREFATNLLPKWSGAPGEAEAFAEESAKRVGGREGAFLYFEIATVIYCQCSDRPTNPTLSWLRIQEGYAVLQADYGVTPMKLNRFASLAYSYRDRAVAKRIFEQIGNNWEASVWRSASVFEAARNWATAGGQQAAAEKPEP